MISARLAEYAIAAALTGLCCWGAYSWAHGRGYSAAEAHYEQILETVRATAARAEERASAAEQAAATINANLETEDQKRAQEAIRQRDAALTELARIRVRLAATLTRRCEVPTIPTSTGSADAAPGEPSERPERADKRLVELGRSCQRDRDRLALWQEWYRAIAASQPAPQTQ